jgi:hypothetical protein
MPDRSLVLTVGVRRSIKIWDLESKNIVDELKPDDVPPSSKKSLPVRLPSYPPPPHPPGPLHPGSRPRLLHVSRL